MTVGGHPGHVTVGGHPGHVGHAMIGGSVVGSRVGHVHVVQVGHGAQVGLSIQVLSAYIIYNIDCIKVYNIIYNIFSIEKITCRRSFIS